MVPWEQPRISERHPLPSENRNEDARPGVFGLRNGFRSSSRFSEEVQAFLRSAVCVCILRGPWKHSITNNLSARTIECSPTHFRLFLVFYVGVVPAVPPNRNEAVVALGLSVFRLLRLDHTDEPAWDHTSREYRQVHNEEDGFRIRIGG